MTGRVCDCWRAGEVKESPRNGGYFYWMNAMHTTGDSSDITLDCMFPLVVVKFKLTVADSFGGKLAT